MQTLRIPNLQTQNRKGQGGLYMRKLLHAAQRRTHGALSDSRRHSEGKEMSIFDNEPLPDGTEFWESRIIRFDADQGKYLVASIYGEKWLSRKNVEDRHADWLLRGVSTRYQAPGNGYNTRFYRRNPDK